MAWRSDKGDPLASAFIGFLDRKAEKMKDAAHEEALKVLFREQRRTGQVWCVVDSCKYLPPVSCILMVLRTHGVPDFSVEVLVELDAVMKLISGTPPEQYNVVCWRHKTVAPFVDEGFARMGPAPDEVEITAVVPLSALIPALESCGALKDWEGR